MGATLVYREKADTEKHSDDGENDQFKYGVTEMQGWRLNMVNIPL
jgi:hypothetical protein